MLRKRLRLQLMEFSHGWGSWLSQKNKRELNSSRFPPCSYIFRHACIMLWYWIEDIIVSTHGFILQDLAPSGGHNILLYLNSMWLTVVHLKFKFYKNYKPLFVYLKKISGSYSFQINIKLICSVILWVGLSSSSSNFFFRMETQLLYVFHHMMFHLNIHLLSQHFSNNRWLM